MSSKGDSAVCAQCTREFIAASNNQRICRSAACRKAAKAEWNRRYRKHRKSRPSRPTPKPPQVWYRGDLNRGRHVNLNDLLAPDDEPDCDLR